MKARPITPEDITKEADRNYDLGRKHGKEEIIELTVNPLLRVLKAFRAYAVRISGGVTGDPTPISGEIGQLITQADSVIHQTNEETKRHQAQSADQSQN